MEFDACSCNSSKDFDTDVEVKLVKYQIKDSEVLGFEDNEGMVINVLGEHLDVNGDIVKRYREEDIDHKKLFKKMMEDL
ncbi:MAG: hypothetical protein ACLFQ8_02445 [Candidatus Aenigmatarchaeota archaeon]